MRESRRARVAVIPERAIDRGELPDSVDLQLALDLLPGPLYWHLTVVRGTADQAYLRRLTTAIVAGIASGPTGATD